MKNFMIAAAVASFSASAAIAGGMAEPTMTVAPAAVAPMAMPVMSADWTGFYAGGQIGAGTVEESTETGTTSGDVTSYGLQAGYLYDLGSFVVGAEGSYAKLDIDGSDTEDYVGRLGVIAGYDAGRFLPYLTAGYANLDLENAPDTFDGYYYGAGVDFAVTSNIRVGVEYLEHKFDDVLDTTDDLSANTTSLKVSYAF